MKLFPFMEFLRHVPRAVKDGCQFGCRTSQKAHGTGVACAPREFQNSDKRSPHSHMLQVHMLSSFFVLVKVLSLCVSTV